MSLCFFVSRFSWKHVGLLVVLFFAAVYLSGCATTNTAGDSPIGPVYGVLLDPGHGGEPEEAATQNNERFNGLGKWEKQGYREECYGAISGNGCMEKTATLAVAKKVKALLEHQDFPVAMTRSTDTYVSLNDRIAKAMSPEYHDWIMVSIHFNRSTDKQQATSLRQKYQAPRGFEIYVLPGEGQRSTMGSNAPGCMDTVNSTRSGNMLLARSMEIRLSEIPGIRDRGIRSAWFVVLRGSPMPSVLIEGGFMSNPSEGSLISSDDYQQKLARAIVAGINDYRAHTTTFAHADAILRKPSITASKSLDSDYLMTAH